MEIFLPVVIVVIIGLIAGLGLALASKFMSVPTDEKTEKIRECLPGANCGACGYSGCDGYAAAIAAGEAEPNKCAPGGAKAAAAIGEILGVTVESKPMVAFVHCNKCAGEVNTKYDYAGMKSCAAANIAQGGPMECAFACIGLGDCQKACPFGAIEMNDGYPVICEDLCLACGKCVSTCPKSVISLVPKEAKVKVRCSNKEKGPATVKVCKVSCIACGMCERVCESGAIKVIDNLATVDYSLCTGCQKCKEACKRNAIV